ncbi:keratin, type II cytoskeletal 2 epidermal-like [Dendrobium catenatum]|uniref:keratin, type II cytoskeletal 2 epidermal-like n=1 Tax=Dendrobium catenatum TaxID=906689 RepID=UPI0009F348C3|nr:keratin, type II cytoskeletal 2 epidermal-like [Dendrobium catenatum]
MAGGDRRSPTCSSRGGGEGSGGGSERDRRRSGIGSGGGKRYVEVKSPGKAGSAKQGGKNVSGGRAAVEASTGGAKGGPVSGDALAGAVRCGKTAAELGASQGTACSGAAYAKQMVWDGLGSVAARGEGRDPGRFTPEARKGCMAKVLDAMQMEEMQVSANPIFEDAAMEFE